MYVCMYVYMHSLCCGWAEGWADGRPRGWVEGSHKGAVLGSMLGCVDGHTIGLRDGCGDSRVQTTSETRITRTVLYCMHAARPDLHGGRAAGLRGRSTQRLARRLRRRPPGGLRGGTA